MSDHFGALCIKGLNRADANSEPGFKDIYVLITVNISSTKRVLFKHRWWHHLGIAKLWTKYMKNKWTIWTSMSTRTVLAKSSYLHGKWLPNSDKCRIRSTCSNFTKKIFDRRCSRMNFAKFSIISFYKILAGNYFYKTPFFASFSFNITEIPAQIQKPT